MHSIDANRVGILDHAVMLVRHGCGVLMIDLRASGESGGDVLIFGGNKCFDVSAAVDYLQSRPDVNPKKRLVSWGFL